MSSYRSFAGAAKAAERLGNLPRAKHRYEKLMELCHGADSARPDLIAARKISGMR